MSLNEVAPPGFGHTKGDEKKGVKKGGTAAAFDRARKRGDFKGSKSDMFAIMWSQKNKGDKPHYKPGTDKKYKKYQAESVVDMVRKYAAKKKKPEKTAQKAMDAGARAKRMLARREYRSKVSSMVPRELEDQKNWIDFKKHLHI